jgi:hypothetical protein
VIQPGAPGHFRLPFAPLLLGLMQRLALNFQSFSSGQDIFDPALLAAFLLALQQGQQLSMLQQFIPEQAD